MRACGCPERSRHTPPLFLTAHDDNGPTVEQADALGAVDFLVKPLVPAVLRAKAAGFIDLLQKTEQGRGQADHLRPGRSLERRAERSKRCNAEEVVVKWPDSSTCRHSTEAVGWQR